MEQTPYNITVKYPLPVHHRPRRPLNHGGIEQPIHNRVTALSPYYLYPFRRQNCFHYTIPSRFSLGPGGPTRSSSRAHIRGHVTRGFIGNNASSFIVTRCFILFVTRKFHGAALSLISLRESWRRTRTFPAPTARLSQRFINSGKAQQFETKFEDFNDRREPDAKHVSGCTPTYKSP